MLTSDMRKKSEGRASWVAWVQRPLADSNTLDVFVYLLFEFIKPLPHTHVV